MDFKDQIKLLSDIYKYKDQTNATFKMYQAQ